VIMLVPQRDPTRRPRVQHDSRGTVPRDRSFLPTHAQPIITTGMAVMIAAATPRSGGIRVDLRRAPA
jgi:hypothetical protein